MNAAGNITRDALLGARARVPQAVVYRSFVKETVILNLESGLYHGVNPTGGKMLETLEKSPSVREAAETLAAVYDQPRSEIESDLCEFCEALIDRRLLELEGV